MYRTNRMPLMLPMKESFSGMYPMPPRIFAPIAIGIKAEHAGVAARSAMKAEKRIDQRGLARPVRTEQADGLSAQHSRKAIEDGATAEPHLKRVEFDCAHTTHVRLGLTGCSPTVKDG